MTNLIAIAFLDFFRHHGIKTIFCVPGAHIETLIVAFAQDPDMQLVVAAHEQGAVAMADGYSRRSGKPGVVFTINGPGILNTVTMANTARQDNSPVLIVSGDAPTSVRGHGAFQESNTRICDTLGIMEKACGWAADIGNVETLRYALARFGNTLKEDPRPLYLNLPADIILAAPHGPIGALHEPEKQVPDPQPAFPPTVGVLGMLISQEGASDSALDRIIAMAHRHRIPVAVSVSAKSLADRIDPSLFLGLYGYAGHERAIRALHDHRMTTILAIGLLWNERNTLAWQLEPARTVALDCELTPKHGPKAAGAMTPRTIDLLERAWGDELSASLEIREAERSRWMSVPMSACPDSDAGVSHLTCSGIVGALNSALGPDSILFVDSGDHRIYATTYFEVSRRRQMITAARTGPMGWAIGAAIGASFVHKEEVWVITGDGCMMMSGNEIAVAARYGCRVRIVVFDNGAYARIALRLRHTPRHVMESIALLPEVEWELYGRSLGADSCRADSPEGMRAAISNASGSPGPFLIAARTPMEDPPCPDGVFSSSSENWIRAHTRKGMK